jgi:hypothetical protein
MSQTASLQPFQASCTLHPAPVGTLKDGYVCIVPLPRAPRIQSVNHVTNNEQVVMDSQDTCYLQVPCVPTWSDLTRLLTGLRKNVLPFLPVRLM